MRPREGRGVVDELGSGRAARVADVRRRLLATLVALAAAPASAPAAAPAPCPGAPLKPSRVITGSFPAARQGSYVMVPFTVPKGVTAVRVKYCWDMPPVAVAGASHTLDLGLYAPVRRKVGTWGRAEFRGWGGSSHPDVTVSPRGFSSEAQYLKAPKAPVAGRTTRGFVPGPIRPGRWAAELGVAAVVPPGEGDPDGVAYRVEVAFSRAPVRAKDRYRPARYSTRAVRGPGWYTGDLHVHAEHSALGDATDRQTFAAAFGPAKLDFITLSDYVVPTGWGEIGRLQKRYPKDLIERSAEVITYRGHLMNHGSARYVDHRTGPVYVRQAGGSLLLQRPARPPRALFGRIHAAGGWTQINHPTIFPSSVPALQRFCRGCPWDYTEAETQIATDVDAIEVVTGPARVGGGPNPFVRTAIDFYERALAAGGHVAAVGSSDSHHADKPEGPTQSPVGQAATVVRADALSENGLQRAVEHGHTYVKPFGAGGPDLRLAARTPGATAPAATFGETVPGSRAKLVVTVKHAPAGSTLVVRRDGATWRSTPLADGDEARTFAADRAGRFGLEVVHGSDLLAFSTPVWVGSLTPLRLVSVSSRKLARTVRSRCRVRGTDARSCTATLRAGRRTVARKRALLTGGRATVALKVPARVTCAVLTVTARDRTGRTVTHRRTLRR
jgi:hypothetical protein